MYSMHALIVVFLLMRLVISIFIAFVTTRHMHGKRNCGVLIVILSFISALYRASSYGELGTFILMDVCLFFNLVMFLASFAFLRRTKKPSRLKQINAATKHAPRFLMRFGFMFALKFLQRRILVAACAAILGPFSLAAGPMALFAPFIMKRALGGIARLPFLALR
eukprot:GEMP01019151.1.p1 GENE.GEMP01019151.1~~GEMP01019151.1.p1  ORF type:complete len:165 (-),score=30.66 GEMP01019151.1:1912-2406(-)